LSCFDITTTSSSPSCPTVDVQLSREMGFMDGKILQKKADEAPYCIFAYRLMKEPVRKAS